MPSPSAFKQCRFGGATTAVVAVVAVCLAAYYPVLNARYADFRAFYCAGQTVLVHGDPYHEHPLRDCQRMVRAPGLAAIVDDITVPAPFPGYVIALFVALAMLPFTVAAAFWLLASIIASVLTVVLAVRVTGAPFGVAAITLAFPTLVTAIQLGQLTPFIGLAMLATSWLLTLGKPRAAAAAAIVIALEPHVALPIFAALLIAVPLMRKPLLIGMTGLIVISLGVLGVGLNAEYLQEVLPAHALANIPDLAQFSASHLAYSVGLPLTLARTLGSVWYAAASIVGIIVACVARRKVGVAAVVLIPPAFALFGGLHVHATQLTLAIPAFLLMAGTDRRTELFAAAVFIAAIPWLSIANYPMLIPALALLAIAFSHAAGYKHIAIPLTIVSATIAVALFRTSFIGVPDHPPPRIFDRGSGNSLAEVSWSIAMLRRDGYSPVAWFIAAKAPTLAAFLFLLTALASDAWRSSSSLRRSFQDGAISLRPQTVTPENAPRLDRPMNTT